MKRITHLILLLAAVPAGAATLYTGDGVPGDREEYQRWAINRARYAPEREADLRLLTNTYPGGSPNYDVCEDTNVNAFGSTTNAWAAWTTSREPLAPNAKLNTAASKHAKDMAVTGALQHGSPSSTYYPSNSTPLQRHAFEGYTNQIVGYYENIASGDRGNSVAYPAEGRPVSNVYAALFVDATIDDRGHRQAMLNSTAREIGIGTFRTNAFVNPFFRTYDYDVEDFGRTSSNHFFTDTIFFDANTNGVYDEREGVGQVEVHLWNGGGEALWYDTSQTSGSFAIPINDLPDASEIWIELRNAGASTNITLPFGYTAAGDITLSNNASFWLGSYRQPNGITNVGFRNMVPAVQQDTAINVSEGLRLTFESFRRATYLVEYSETGPSGPWFNAGSLTATTSTTSVTLPTTGDTRIYRVSLLKD